eukprot:scaffold512_cov75-Cyclotella_meneghiniana.AAC.8
MKLALLTIFPVATAFTLSPYAQSTRSSILQLGREGNVDFGGNTWKPDSEKMGSTDTGDYFPEGYDPKEQIAFTEGMGGSQGFGGDRGPALPGMENLGADAVLMGGIEEASEIPAGMEFVMSSVPDGSFEMQVASNSKGGEILLSVKPVCMGFEDFYAAFTSDSHPSFSVSPVAGRMDRRGGEPTEFVVSCTPNGKAGAFEGNLVINLPEDNSKICYKITANSF